MKQLSGFLLVLCGFSCDDDSPLWEGSGLLSSCPTTLNPRLQLQGPRRMCYPGVASAFTLCVGKKRSDEGTPPLFVDTATLHPTSTVCEWFLSPFVWQTSLISGVPRVTHFPEASLASLSQSYSRTSGRILQPIVGVLHRLSDIHLQTLSFILSAISSMVYPTSFLISQVFIIKVLF